MSAVQGQKELLQTLAARKAHQDVDRGVWVAVSTSTKPRWCAVPKVVGGKLMWMCWFSALLFHCVSTNSCAHTDGTVHKVATSCPPSRRTSPFFNCRTPIASTSEHYEPC